LVWRWWITVVFAGEHLLFLISFHREGLGSGKQWFFGDFVWGLNRAGDVGLW
jgi:hypothetical protein